MKLFKVNFKKHNIVTPKDMVKSILAKYPDAHVNDIFATILKQNGSVSLSSIRCYKSEFMRMKAIKLAMGVK